MTTTLTATSSMHEQLLARFEHAHVRDRLDAELTWMVIDVIGPCDRDELPPDECAWLTERVSHAVRVVLEPTLARLTNELATGLVDAPDDLLARVNRAQLRRDLGGE